MRHAAAGPLSFAEGWLAALGFAMQIYFDFSGYSDIAIGLGLLFGIVIPDNFDAPYRTTCVIDFWRRWHMTLSRMLRDYLYISLGGSRYGLSRQMAALLVTMLLGGLWHGAGWTFVDLGRPPRPRARRQPSVAARRRRDAVAARLAPDLPVRGRRLRHFPRRHDVERAPCARRDGRGGRDGRGRCGSSSPAGGRRCSARSSPRP